MDNIDNLITIIKNSKNLVFFGGAGVSTESGLKDFRSTNGLYSENYKYPPEYMLSHDCFINKTKDFFDFYKNKMNSLNYKPNITHEVLKILEDKGLLKTIITQNIDGFHTMAGSKNVLELHGSIKRNYCTLCHKFYDADAIFNCKDIPKCSCKGIIKPDVILYGEPLNDNIVNEAIKAISDCDTLIIGGTSLIVYPAASFINYFKGEHLILINNDSTTFDDRCDLVIHDSIGEVFKKIKENL